jgi:hypothetical protein
MTSVSKTILRMADCYPLALIMPSGLAAVYQPMSDFIVRFCPTVSAKEELLWSVSSPLPELLAANRGGKTKSSPVLRNWRGKT